MRTAVSRAPYPPVPVEGEEPESVTLLELVKAVSEVTDDDREIVATVRHMLQSGRARLCGNFRDVSLKEFS